MNTKRQIKLLCRWLRVWRSVKGLTQEEVATATGIVVSNFENGRCEPKLRTLLILCDFYGLSLPWLLRTIQEIGTLEISDTELYRMARINHK